MTEYMVWYEHAGQWGWAEAGLYKGEIGEVLGEMVVLVEVEEVKGEAEGILCPDGVRRTPRRRWELRGEGGERRGYLVEVEV